MKSCSEDSKDGLFATFQNKRFSEIEEAFKKFGIKSQATVAATPTAQDSDPLHVEANATLSDTSSSSKIFTKYLYTRNTYMFKETKIKAIP